MEIDSLEKLTEFFNRPLDKRFSDYCKSDLDFFYIIQFKSDLTSLRALTSLLISHEDFIHRHYGDISEHYNSIRLDVLMGIHTIKHCKKSFEYLIKKKYFKLKEIKSFEKEITKIDDIVLKYSKKYGVAQEYD